MPLNLIKHSLFLLINKTSYFITDFKYYLLFFFLAIFLAGLILLRHRNRIILILTSSCLFLIACLLLLEAYFRYLYDQSDGLGFLKVNQKWHQRHVVFNNYFKRDRNFEPQKQPDEIRIAVMGDSIAFGGGIENVQHRFSNRLEQQLRADGFNVNVYNLAVSGTDTSEQIASFQNLRHLNFDLLIWQYFFNDANPQSGNLGTQIIRRRQVSFAPQPPIKFLTDRSFFADWLYWRLSSKYTQTFKDLAAADLKAYQNQANLRRHQSEIKNFLNQLKAENLPTVVILFPLLYQNQSLFASQAYSTMLNFFQSTSAAAVIDLSSRLKSYPVSQLTAGRFDSHPNELVHQIAAQALYQQVKPLIIR